MSSVGLGTVHEGWQNEGEGATISDLQSMKVESMPSGLEVLSAHSEEKFAKQEPAANLLQQRSEITKKNLEALSAHSEEKFAKQESAANLLQQRSEITKKNLGASDIQPLSASDLELCGAEMLQRPSSTVLEAKASSHRSFAVPVSSSGMELKRQKSDLNTGIAQNTSSIKFRSQQSLGKLAASESKSSRQTSQGAIADAAPFSTEAKSSSALKLATVASGELIRGIHHLRGSNTINLEKTSLPKSRSVLESTSVKNFEATYPLKVHKPKSLESSVTKNPDAGSVMTLSPKQSMTSKSVSARNSGLKIEKSRDRLTMAQQLPSNTASPSNLKLAGSQKSLGSMEQSDHQTNIAGIRSTTSPIHSAHATSSQRLSVSKTISPELDDFPESRSPSEQQEQPALEKVAPKSGFQNLVKRFSSIFSSTPGKGAVKSKEVQQTVSESGFDPDLVDMTLPPEFEAAAGVAKAAIDTSSAESPTKVLAADVQKLKREESMLRHSLNKLDEAMGRTKRIISSNNLAEKMNAKSKERVLNTNKMASKERIGNKNTKTDAKSNLDIALDNIIKKLIDNKDQIIATPNNEASDGSPQENQMLSLAKISQLIKLAMDSMYNIPSEETSTVKTKLSRGTIVNENRPVMVHGVRAIPQFSETFDLPSKKSQNKVRSLALAQDSLGRAALADSPGVTGKKLMKAAGGKKTFEVSNGSPLELSRTKAGLDTMKNARNSPVGLGVRKNLEIKGRVTQGRDLKNKPSPSTYTPGTYPSNLPRTGPPMRVTPNRGQPSGGAKNLITSSTKPPAKLPKREAGTMGPPPPMFYSEFTANKLEPGIRDIKRGYRPVFNRAEKRNPPTIEPKKIEPKASMRGSSMKTEASRIQRNSFVSPVAFASTTQPSHTRTGGGPSSAVKIAGNRSRGSPQGSPTPSAAIRPADQKIFSKGRVQVSDITDKINYPRTAARMNQRASASPVRGQHNKILKNAKNNATETTAVKPEDSFSKGNIAKAAKTRMSSAHHNSRSVSTSIDIIPSPNTDLYNSTFLLKDLGPDPSIDVPNILN